MQKTSFFEKNNALIEEIASLVNDIWISLKTSSFDEKKESKCNEELKEVQKLLKNIKRSI